MSKAYTYLKMHVNISSFYDSLCVDQSVDKSNRRVE